MAEELIPAAQLARELSRTPTTLRNWRRAGAGPSWLRVRGRVMYRRQSVDQWIEAMQQHASKEYETTNVKDQENDQ